MPDKFDQSGNINLPAPQRSARCSSLAGEYRNIAGIAAGTGEQVIPWDAFLISRGVQPESCPSGSKAK